MIYRVAVTADGQPYGGSHAVEVDAPNEQEAAARALAHVRAKVHVVEVVDGPETSERTIRPYRPRHAAPGFRDVR